MDKACAILGVFAAFMWIWDFILIFGFCGSSGRYGPHRETSGSRRGQISPGDLEDYSPAGEVRQYGPGGRGNADDSHRTDHYPQEDYYDTLDQRKRELDWIEHPNTADPKGYTQAAIPLSMQQPSFYAQDPAPPPLPNETTTAGQTGLSIGEAPTEPISNFELNMADAAHHTNFPMETTTTTALSPPPVARTEWRQTSPVSQNSTAQTRQDQRSSIEGPLFTTRGATTAMQDPSVQGGLAVHETEDQVTTASSSPRYTEFPPGPACYVFESNQQEFLPSYVNMAARFEQKQGLKQSRSQPPTPVSATPPRNSSSQRIAITGLGFDVVSRDEADIAAEKIIDNGVSTAPQQGLTPRPIDTLPSRKPVLSSEQDRASQPLSSPTGSQKSFMNGNVNENAQGQGNRKPALTKRKTSKLSILTSKSSNPNISSNNTSVTMNDANNSSATLNNDGAGLNSAATSAVGTPKEGMNSPFPKQTASQGTEVLPSPMSSYVGDF
ncbi:hypothetical protein BGZ51_000666 [Haplosporangium sp. Z 767]|nr:hypothetical protein BGZ51_000666 [Haplosporangium sp. Z 767]KAF9190372.1 hypothetical protein BGZ50_000260 [Haplosporangium sp. Z 11]